MKKILKITSIILIIMLILSNFIYATDDIVGAMQPNKWNDGGGNNNFVTNIMGMILGVVQIVGAVAVVLSIVILGMRYMVSSINDKATIKQQMIPIVIGSVILFTAASILKLIAGFTAQALK